MAFSNFSSNTFIGLKKLRKSIGCDACYMAREHESRSCRAGTFSGFRITDKTLAKLSWVAKLKSYTS